MRREQFQAADVTSNIDTMKRTFGTIALEFVTVNGKSRPIEMELDPEVEFTSAGRTR